MQEPIIVNGKMVAKHMMNKVMEEDFKFDDITTLKPKSLKSMFFSKITFFRKIFQLFTHLFSNHKTSKSTS